MTPRELENALLEGAPQLSARERWHLVAISMVVTGGNPGFRLSNIGADRTDAAGAWGLSEKVWGPVPVPGTINAQATQAAKAWARHPLSSRMQYVFPSPADRVAWFARLWWHVREVSSLGRVAENYSETHRDDYFERAQELFDEYPEFEHMSQEINRAGGVPWAWVLGGLALAVALWLIVRR